MKKLNKNNGITLIALVITIIVMLILVGVSISMAVNGGLFGYAGKAVADTENEKNKEKEIANGGRIKVGNTWYDSLQDVADNKPSENQGDGTTPDEKGKLPEELKVGDYVNYTPTTGTYEVTGTVSGYGTTSQTFETEKGENALEWRVWSIDEGMGTVELISATAAQISKNLSLFGADGYNHAVDILNDLCKELYSNTKGATARSINIEDVNAKTTYDYTTYTNYGTVYTPSLKEYPNIYAKELGSTVNGLEETGDLLTTSEGVRNSDGTADYTTYTGFSTADTLYVTSTCYHYMPENHINSELGINTVPTGLIVLETDYWLASRAVFVDGGIAYYNLRCITNAGMIARLDSYDNGGRTGGGKYPVRPVVSLSSNVSLTKDEDNSNESITYWNIEF